ERMDLQVGRVRRALDANGIANSTIVVFTSDNGGERVADTWPFTRRQTELLGGGLRIPWIIAWPERMPRGRSTDQVALSMDWVPTLVAAGGGQPNPDHPFDGINLLPFLTAGAPTVARTVFWRYKANAQRAVRDG